MGVAETKYFIDADGKYLGGWCGTTDGLPDGAIQVSNPPESASAIWDFNTEKWIIDSV